MRLPSPRKDHRGELPIQPEEARNTGDAGSDTQSRVLVTSEGREPEHSALPFGSLSTVTFAQESEHQKTDLIPANTGL